MKKIGLILFDIDNNIFFNSDFIRFFNDIDVSIIGIINNNIIDVINNINLCDGVIVCNLIDNNIIDYLYKIDKPCLFINLGMISLGKYFNSSIKKITNNSEYSKIKIKENTLLYNILSLDYITVKNNYKYYIEDTDLIISSYNLDYIINSIEVPNKKFFLGILFDISDKDNLNNKLIIEDFINKC